MTANDYRNILQQDPLNQEAFDGLLDDYKQAQRWPDACRLLEARASAAAAAGDRDEGVRCLLSAGEMWQEQVDDQGRACDCFRQVLQIEPGNKAAVNALSKAYQELNRWNEYADLLKTRIETELDPAQKAKLSFEAARVFSERLQNSRTALLILMDIEKEHPAERARVIKGLHSLADAWAGSDSPMMDDLYKAAEKLSEWELAADLLKKQAQFADNPSVKGNLLQARAALALDKLHDRRLSVDWYVEAIAANPANGDSILATIKEMLQGAPDDLHSLSALREACLSLGKWQEAAICIEKEIEANTDAQTKAKLYLKLAGLKETRLGDPILAGQLYQKAFQQHPSVGDEVVEGLQNLLKMSEHKNNTALRKSLADVLEKLDRVDDVASILKKGAAAARSPEEAVELYCRAGEILAEKQPDTPSKAREMFAAALEANPTGSNTRALAGLEALARNHESDTATMEELRSYYTNREQWQDLLRIVSTIDESEADSGKKATLRFELGHILEQRLGRKDSALSHYQAALKLNPAENIYLEAARNLYRELNLWDTVLKLIETQLDLISSGSSGSSKTSSTYLANEERKTDLIIEKAEVHLIHRDDPIAAFNVLSGILRDDFSNEQAQTLAKNLVSRESSRKMVLRAIMADSKTILAASGEAARGGLAADSAETGTGTSASASTSTGTGAATGSREVVDGIQSAVQSLLLMAQVCELEPADPGAAVEAWQAALELKPDMEDTFYSVEDGLTKAARWQELVEFYEKAANRDMENQDSGKKERRADWLCKAAAIQVEYLKDVAGGFTNLSTAYTINPANAAIRAQMVDRLRKAEAWRYLSQAYELVLNLSPESANREFSIAILEQAAGLKAGRLKDEHGAADLYEKLIELDPAHPAAVNFLRQYLRDNDQYKKLLQLLDNASAALATGGPDYLKDAAEICELQLGDIEGAMKRWNKRLELMPRDDSTIKALRRLYTLVGRWSDMIDLVVAEAEGRSSISHRVDLYREAARLARDRVGDQKRAEQIYLKILAMLPGDVESLESLDSIYDRDSRWPELARILTMRSVQAEQDGNTTVSIACRLRRARILIEELFQVSDGVTELDRIVDMAPENAKGDGALIAAERLLDGTSAHDQMLRLLEKRLARAEQQAPVLEITSGRRTADDAASRVQSPQKQDEIARLLEKAAVTAQDGLHDYTRAVKYWTRLLEVVPQEQNALKGLAACHEKLGQWSELVTLLRQLADLQQDLSSKAEHLEQLASVYEKRLVDLESSSRIWEELTNLKPDNYDYHGRLATALRNLQAWEQLAQAMNRHIAVEKDITRLSGLLVSLAQVYDEHLDDRMQAVSLLQQARKHATGENREVLSYLRRLLLGENDYAGAVSTLEEEATMTPVAEAMGLLLQAAEIEQHQLGRLEDAAIRCEGMLDEDPTNKAVLRKLVELYSLLENNRSLVDAIEKLLPLLDHRAKAEATEKGELLLKLVAAEIDLGRDKSAFDKGTRNLAQVQDLDTLFQLLGETASRNTDLWEKMLLVLDEAAKSLAINSSDANSAGVTAGAADSTSRLVRLHRERATIFENQLDKAKDAFRVWNDIFQIPTIDDRDRLGVVAHMARLADQAGSHRELGEAYSTLLKRFPGKADTGAGIRAVSTTGSKGAGDDADGIERAFDEDSTDNADRDDLFSKLVAGRSVEDLDIRYSLLEKRGVIQEEHLGDYWAAFADYSELSLLAKDESERDKYLAAAERVAGKGGIWEDHILLLDKHRRASDNDNEKISFHLRAGEILYGELDEAEKAFDRFFNAFMLNMDDDAVLKQMQELAAEQDAWHWLARVYVAGSREARNPESKVRFLRMLGDLQCEHLENPSGGCDTWSLAYRLMPEDDELLQSFVQVGQKYERLEKIATVIEEMATALQAAGDWSREKVQRERAIALFTGPMEQTGRAVPHWERFLVVDPGDRKTVENLANYYSQAGEHRKLLVLHEAVLDQLKDPKERAEMLCRTADVQAEGLGEKQEAVYTMRSAAAIAPDHAPVVRKLARFEGEVLNDWEEAARLHQQLADEVHILGSEDWGRDLLEVARIYSNKLEQPEKAVNVLRHVLAQRPDGDDLSAEVEGLCSSAGLWTDYVEILGDRVRTIKDADLQTKNKLLIKMAVISDSRLERTDQAIGYLEQILETAPDHVAALEKLAEITGRNDDYSRTVDILFRLGDALLSHGHDVADLGGEADTQAVTETGACASADDVEVQAGAAGDLGMDQAQAQAAQAQAARAAHVFMEAGKILLEKQEDLNQAARAYAKARKADNTNPAPLHALDGIFTRLGRYDASFEIRLLIASMDEDVNPAQAAAHYLNAAQAAEMLSTSPRVSVDDNAEVGDEGNDRDDALLRALSAAVVLDKAALPAVMERRIKAMKDGENQLAIKLIDLEIGAAISTEEKTAEPQVMAGPEAAQSIEDQEACEASEASESPGVFEAEGQAALEAQSDLADSGDLDDHQDGTENREELAALRLEKALILERMGGQYLNISLEEYQAVLEISPDSVTAGKGLGRVLRKQDRWDELVKFLETQLMVLEQDHAAEPVRKRDALVELALVTAKAGDRGRAIEYLHQAIEIDSNYAIALEALAGLETENGNIAEAAALYGRLIQVLRTAVSEDKLVEWYRRRASLLHQSGDNTQAMEAWQGLLTIWPDDLEALDHLALVAAEAEEWGEAIGALELLIHGVEQEYGEPDKDDANDNEGDEEEEDGDQPEDDEAYGEKQRQDRNSSEYVGDAEGEDEDEDDTDDDDEDDEDYEYDDQWLHVEGRSELYLRLAHALTKLDEVEDAIAQLEKVRAMLPRTSQLLPATLLQLLDLKKSMGIADEALAVARELESIVTSDQARNEASAEVSRLKGFIVLRDGGDPADAEAAFAKVLEHFPEDEGAMAGLLEALRQAGKNGEILRVRKNHVDRLVTAEKPIDAEQALAVANDLEDADENTLCGLDGETDAIVYYRLALESAGDDQDVIFKASRQIALLEATRVISSEAASDDQVEDGKLESLNQAIQTLGKIAIQDPEDRDVLEELLSLLTARANEDAEAEADVTAAAKATVPAAQIQLLLGEESGLFNEEIMSAMTSMARQVPVAELLSPILPITAIFTALSARCPDLFPFSELPRASERLDLAEKEESDELGGVPELFRELRSTLASALADGASSGGSLSEQMAQAELYLYPAPALKVAPAFLEGKRPVVLVSEGFLELATDKDRIAFMLGSALCGTLPGFHYATVLDPEEGEALMGALRGDSDGEMAAAWKTCIDVAGAQKLRLAAATLLGDQQYQALSYADYLNGVRSACDRTGFLLCGKLDAAYRAISAEMADSDDTAGSIRLGKLVGFMLDGVGQGDYSPAHLAFTNSMDELARLTAQLHANAQSLPDASGGSGGEAPGAASGHQENISTEDQHGGDSHGKKKKKKKKQG